MDLNVEALCATLGPGGTSWDRLRGPFVAALQAIAAREEMRFVVTLEWRFRLAGIDTLGLRVIHKESTWTPKRLGKPVPNLRGALLVTAQDVKRLDASAFTQERVASLLA